LFAILAIMLIVQMIYAVLTTFVYPLIAEREISGIDATLLSLRAGLSNLGGLILLFILLGLMMFAGALLCLIGVIFVGPLIYASNYAAFRSVFPSERSIRNEMPPPPPTWGSPQPGY
jgi:uncharacterized membrane protein